MHDADKGGGGASAETARRPEGNAVGVGPYAHSGRVGELLASATMSTAYRADRAEELERPTRPTAYCWFSLALVALACACLIFAAATGAAWLLTVAVAVALLAAAVATCA